MSHRVGRGVLVLFLVTIGLLPSARHAAASDIECFNVTCSRLTFTVSGNGTGHVYTRTSPDGLGDNKINCFWEGGKQSGTCSYQYLVDELLGSREIYYRVLADEYSEGCELASCIRDRTVLTELFYGADSPRAYTFELVNPFTVTVTKSGSGAGSVKSTPDRLLCGSVCSVDFGLGLELTLAATAGASSTFQGWTGPCTGTAHLCTFVVSADTAVGAMFQAIPVATKTPPPAVTAGPTKVPTTTVPPPAITAGPAVSSAPATAAPGSSAQPPPAPTEPFGPTSGPAQTDAASPASSIEPNPAADRTADLTPIALAIVIAAVVLAAGIAAAAYLMRRRASA